MKPAITATPPQFATPFETRFGCGKYFIAVDTKTHEWEALSKKERKSWMRISVN